MLHVVVCCSALKNDAALPAQGMRAGNEIREPCGFSVSWSHGRYSGDDDR